MHTIDEGENFRLLLHKEIAVCQVWSRPDVTAEEGARYAAVVMNTLRSLLGDDDVPLTGIVFDLRLAAGPVGPRTEALLQDLIQSWGFAERWVCVLVSEVPAFLVQMDAVVQGTIPERGFATTEDEVAYAFAASGQRPAR